jgi:flagellar motor component MotA
MSQSQHIEGQQQPPSSTFSATQKIATGHHPSSEDIKGTLDEIKVPLQEHPRDGKEGKIASHAESLVQHTKEILEEKRPEESFEKIQQHSREINETMIQLTKEKDVHELWGEEQVSELKGMLESFRGAFLALARNKKFRQEIMETLHIFQMMVADATKTTIEKKANKQEPLPYKEDFVSILPTQKLIAPSLEQGYRDYHKTEIAGHFERSRTDLRQKLRGLLIELGRCKEYKNFIQKLFGFTRHNDKRLRVVYAQGNEKYQAPFNLLADDIQELIEKFSGGKSLTPLRKRLGKIWESVRNDQEISDFFGQFREVITSTLEEPEKQDTHKLDTQMNSFYEKARLILTKKTYREDLLFVLSELRHVIRRIRQDTHVKNIASDVSALRKEMFLNKKGQVDLQVLRESLPALRNVLVPTLTSSINKIPIPPIRSENEKYLFEATNVNFAATDLLPETLKIKFNNLVRFDFSGVGMDRLDSELIVSLKDFHSHLEDIHFHYERKTMPTITDHGVVDVDVTGTSVKIRWRIEYAEGRLQFLLESVRCQMTDLNINVKEANHSFLDKFVLRYFNTTIKNRMVHSMEETLREKLQKISIDTKKGLDAIKPAEQS